MCVQYSTVKNTHIVYHQRLWMCSVLYSTGYSYCLLSEVIVMKCSTVKGTNIVYYQRLWMGTELYMVAGSRAHILQQTYRLQIKQWRR